MILSRLSQVIILKIGVSMCSSQILPKISQNFQTKIWSAHDMKHFLFTIIPKMFHMRCGKYVFSPRWVTKHHFAKWWIYWGSAQILGGNRKEWKRWESEKYSKSLGGKRTGNSQKISKFLKTPSWRINHLPTTHPFNWSIMFNYAGVEAHFILCQCQHCHCYRLSPW